MFPAADLEFNSGPVWCLALGVIQRVRPCLFGLAPKQYTFCFCGGSIFETHLVPLGHVGFRRVSVRAPFWHDWTRRGSTGRSTVPYWCTIDVRSHTGPYGGPTGPLGAFRDPAGPRRTAGGTVGPRLIGASPVWAARSSYRRRPGLLSFVDSQLLFALEGKPLGQANLKPLHCPAPSIILAAPCRRTQY